MADKVLVQKANDPDARPVKMNARLARALVANGKLKYAADPDAKPVKRVVSAPAPAPAPKPAKKKTSKKDMTSETPAAGKGRYRRRDEQADE